MPFDGGRWRGGGGIAPCVRRREALSGHRGKKKKKEPREAKKMTKEKEKTTGWRTDSLTHSPVSKCESEAEDRKKKPASSSQAAAAVHGSIVPAQAGRGGKGSRAPLGKSAKAAGSLRARRRRRRQRRRGHLGDYRAARRDPSGGPCDRKLSQKLATCAEEAEAESEKGAGSGKG